VNAELSRVSPLELAAVLLGGRESAGRRRRCCRGDARAKAEDAHRRAADRFACSSLTGASSTPGADLGFDPGIPGRVLAGRASLYDQTLDGKLSRATAAAVLRA
jgi:hypothetical protein